MANKTDNNTRLKEIFCKILKIKKSNYSEKISIQNVKKWDSLNHLRLILEIERQFKVQFAHKMVPKLQSIKIIKLKLKEQKIKFQFIKKFKLFVFFILYILINCLICVEGSFSFKILNPIFKFNQVKKRFSFFATPIHLNFLVFKRFL